MLYVFWLSVLLLVHHLFLYGWMLYLCNKLFIRSAELPKVCESALPTITVLCAAFNEAASIEAKIQSFLALDYPADKIKLVVVSDDSTDGTNELVQKYVSERVKLIIQKPRRGKQSAHNLARGGIDSDFVLSTDANSIFDPQAARYLVQTMLSDDKIGIVSGELKLLKAGSQESGEGLYWKYESFLKTLDSDFHSIVGSNGSIYLIRRELFEEIHPASVDDFERTLTTLKAGFLAKYQPRAIVTEEVTERATQEIKRKIRIITREWFVLGRNLALLNNRRFPKVSFMLLSHKVLRWLFFIPALLILLSSGVMWQQPFFGVIFGLEVAAYTLGGIGLMAQKNGKRIPGAGMPAYITAMVYASLIAFVNLLKGKQTGTWNTVR